MLLDTWGVPIWCKNWVFIIYLWYYTLIDAFRINVTWYIPPLYVNLEHWYMLLIVLSEKAFLLSSILTVHLIIYICCFLFVLFYMRFWCISIYMLGSQLLESSSLLSIFVLYYRLLCVLRLLYFSVFSRLWLMLAVLWRLYLNIPHLCIIRFRLIL